jgi:hypothetical protein
VSVHEKKKVVALMADDGIPFAIVLGSLDLDGALNGKVEPLVGLEHEALIVIAHGVAVVTALRTKPGGAARFVSKQATTTVLKGMQMSKGQDIPGLHLDPLSVLLILGLDLDDCDVLLEWIEKAQVVVEQIRVLSTRGPALRENEQEP